MKSTRILTTILLLTFALISVVLVDGCLPKASTRVFSVMQHNYVLDTTKFVGTCVGFHMDETYFLTVAHVVTDPRVDMYYIKLSEEDLRPVTIKCKDDSLDLALLSIQDPPPMRPPRFKDPFDMKFGDKIFTSGYPGFLRGKITAEGMVLQETNGELYFIGFIGGGMSGGPVMNEFDEILGLLIGYAKPKASEYVNIAVTAPVIEQFLLECLHGRD